MLPEILPERKSVSDKLSAADI